MRNVHCKFVYSFIVDGMCLIQCNGNKSRAKASISIQHETEIEETRFGMPKIKNGCKKEHGRNVQE